MLDFDAICRGRMYFWRSVRALRSRLWTLFVVAGHRLFLQAFFQKWTLNAICGVPEHLAILLFAFDAWFWCYMSWPDVLLKVSACLQKLTLNAICRGRTSFVFSCFFSEVDFECYLSWTHGLLEFTACFQKLAFAIVLPFVVAMLSFRSWLWMLFVVFGVTFGGTICNF